MGYLSGDTFELFILGEHSTSQLLTFSNFYALDISWENTLCYGLLPVLGGFKRTVLDGRICSLGIAGHSWYGKVDETGIWTLSYGIVAGTRSSWYVVMGTCHSEDKIYCEPI